MSIKCVSDNKTLNDSFIPLHLRTKCAMHTLQNTYQIWQIDNHPLVRYEIVTQDSSLLECYAVSHGKHFSTCKGPLCLHVLRQSVVWHSVPVIMKLLPKICVLLTSCNSHYEAPSPALCATDIP